MGSAVLCCALLVGCHTACVSLFEFVLAALRLHKLCSCWEFSVRATRRRRWVNRVDLVVVVDPNHRMIRLLILVGGGGEVVAKWEAGCLYVGCVFGTHLWWLRWLACGW